MRRRTKLETLESRLLMAADIDCGSSGGGQSALSFGYVDQVPALFAPASLNRSDAGSTLSTAAKAGPIDGERQFRGSLDYFDRVDLLQFEVERDAAVQIDLSGMRTNANLVLLDERGRLLQYSARPGRLAESLQTELAAGTYYVGVIGASAWSNRYLLRIDARLETPASLPETPELGLPVDQGEPVSATPAPPTAPSASPAQPLPQVSYFGSGNDWNVNQVNAPEAWAAGYRGQGITVAVVDTGVDLDHPDLVHSLYVNPGEIPGNGLDDDQNGFVDDVSGYDFVDRDAVPDDTNGHGTHVAGTIAAAHNGIGANGIAPNAKILPIRVLGSNGSGSDSGVAAGIRYAAQMGAQIINLSLGGGCRSRQ